MACMCGDTACPSCGTAQGTWPEDWGREELLEELRQVYDELAAWHSVREKIQARRKWEAEHGGDAKPLVMGTLPRAMAAIKAAKDMIREAVG